MPFGKKSLATSAVVVVLGLTFCDPRAVMYENFKKKPLLDQISARKCPAVSEKVAIDQSIQVLSLGPYTMRYETNFLQIDAHRTQTRGQYEYVGGQRQLIPINRKWVQIHTLAPDMVPNFSADSSYRRREARGDIFLVGIELFWSEDGSWKPDDGEQIGNLTGSEPTSAARATSIGLEEYELQPWSGWRKRLVPDSQHSATYPFKLLCSGPNEPGSGTCHVVKRLRPDVWTRYSFGTENTRCWREIDGLVESLLVRFTDNWNERAK